MFINKLIKAFEISIIIAIVIIIYFAFDLLVKAKLIKS
jgi:hypothetical protein